MLHIGNVLETFDIAERGLAVMLDTDAFDLRDDRVIYIDDPIRVLSADGSHFDCTVRGIQCRPCVTILLSDSVDAASVARGDQVFLLR